jgi:hypothetical protein
MRIWTWVLSHLAGGVLHAIGGSLFVAVCLVWGFAPDEFFAWLIRNPGWLTSPWMRTLVVIVGVAVVLAATLVKRKPTSSAAPDNKRTGHTLTQYSPPVPTGLYTKKWVLNYNPSNPKGRKDISFNEDGTIGDGNNHNEYRWSYTNDHLDIWMKDKRLHNRFKYDPPSGKFLCTNDLDAQGVKHQIIYQGRA